MKLNGKKANVVEDWPNKPITDPSKLGSGNIGLNHGYSKTCTLDIDHVAAEYALKLVGIDLAALLASVPYKIIGDPDNPPKPLFKLPAGIDLATKQLRWPDPDGRTNSNGAPKLVTIFELRGGPGFQDVLPPSIHPDTQDPYTWLGGPPPAPGDIPTIPQELLGLWLTWDIQESRLKTACPWIEPPTSPTPQAAKNNGTYNPDFDVNIVQTAFNNRYTPGDILEKHGYTPKGKKWLCPNSDSGNPGVMLMADGDKVWSYHGSDPLGDGHPHDAYDCYAILEHGGDHKTAWHTAKDELGLDIGTRAVGIAQANEAKRTPAGDVAPPAPDLLPFPAADEGNAQAALLLHGDSYLYTGELGWLYYNGKHWAAKGGGERLNRAIVDTLIERRTQAVKADLEPIVKATKPSANNVRNCKYMLQSILWASIDDFDNNPDLLNCDNGVVNLKTGQLTTHDYGQRFTYCIDTPYDPHADDNTWEDWLYDTIRPADNADDKGGVYAKLGEWLQMAVGYSLTGHTHEQCLFFLQGPPRAGKGVFLQTLDKLLGRPLSSGVDFDTFTDKRGGDSQNFDLAPLKACRLITASESKRTTMLNAKRVKGITGADPVYCAHKRKDFFSYTPQYKIWLSSNFKVMAAADDDALWSRLRIINFPNSHLGKENFGLEAQLWESRTGILKWAVAGAIAWYQRKAANVGLGHPKIITNAVQAHRNENDTVVQFIDDCCLVGSEQYAVGAQLTKAYRAWCNENSLQALGGRRLGEALRRKHFEHKQKWVEGKNAKCWLGIGLLT